MPSSIRPPSHLDHLPRRHIAWLLLAALGPEAAWAAVATGANFDPDHVDFNTSFGGLRNSQLDISRFERANAVLPGTYRVDLFVNDIHLLRDDVVFRDVPSRHRTVPCISYAMLEKLGVDRDKLGPPSLGADCIDLAEVVPGAQIHFDTGSQRLDLSIPQASLRRQARGYVSPVLWEYGTTAATLSYNLNAYQNDDTRGSRQRGAFLGLNTGLNLGGWRLHHQATATWSTGADRQWQNIGAYAQHDLTRLRSQLTLGDNFTTGELFQSTGFRGASMASDDRMLPDSMTGYAPTVRGVADTRARVEIRQNDYLIYETTVAPGAFEINDLYATGYGGDLQVSVIEADGRERRFSVPYAAVPRLLRPGLSRYAVTMGQVRGLPLYGSRPSFAEATYQRGLNNWLTGYAGAQATQHQVYRSALLGAAVNTGVGAFSLDVTTAQAHPRPGEGSASGHSLRATYSKSIPAFNTDFALAAYRYSSRNYLDLTDAVSLRGGRYAGLAYNAVPVGLHARNRFQLTLNQRLGDTAGSLYASGSYYSYWNNQPKVSTYQLGYNNRFGRVSYAVTANRTRADSGRSDTQYFLSIAMPLGSSGRRPLLLNGNAAGGGQQGTSLRAGLSGTAGERSQFNYGVNATDRERGTDNIDAHLNWLTPYTVVGGAYSWSEHTRQATLMASGGIVAHAGGITFAQRMSETIGIVEAKRASGALLANGSQGRVDSRGYAVVSDLMPYRMNDVMLDPKGTSMDVELRSSRLQVAPRAGAVVPLKFETSSGRAVLIQGRQAHGETLPFGAQVLDAQGLEIGVVGQGGRVFARGGEQGDTLTVRWGESATQQCRLDYRLPARASNDRNSGFSTTEAECR